MNHPVLALLGLIFPASAILGVFIGRYVVARGFGTPRDSVHAAQRDAGQKRASIFFLVSFSLAGLAFALVVLLH